MPHTPGPWRYFDPIGDNNPDTQGYFEVAGGDGYTPNGFNLTGYIGEDDARLTAAAPDPLAALIDLTRTCEKLGYYGTTLEAAGAAINKAAGL